jgi:adenylate cyclase
MRRTRLFHSLLVPPVILVVCVLLGLAGIFTYAGGWMYDTLLRVRPSAPAAPVVLLIDVDPEATAAAGPWPWSRDVLADGLVVLKEMNASYAVLDLPLGQKSAPGLDPSALRQALPAALDREFLQMEENIQSLFEAIRRGSVRPQDSPRYVSDLIGLVALAKIRLREAAMGIERDDDTLLGQAAKFFGRTFVPLEILSSPDSAADMNLAEEASRALALPVRVPGADPSMRIPGIGPAVLPVLRGARGGGFADLLPDSDGVRRRATLMGEYDGAHFGQITFAALLDLLGNPGVELGTRNIVLRIEARGGSAARTLTIPLTEAGQALLEWPRSRIGDGFRHLSWAAIFRSERLEDSLITSFREMDGHGYLSYLRSETGLLDVYEYGSRLKNEMLAAGDPGNAGAWRNARARFFTLADQFLGGDAEARIIADADRAVRSESLTEGERKGIQDERGRVPDAFAAARRTFAELQQTRATLEAALQGSFCIVSLSSSRQALRAGRTPFGTAATDAGASAALVSTALSGRFPREVPSRYPLGLAALLSVLAAVVVYRMRPMPALLCGLALGGAAVVVPSAVFLLFGVFMNPLLPAADVLFTCALLAALKVSAARREARAVRNAFSGRLSRESMQRLLASPRDRASAGERRNVTVMSAAVKRPFPDALPDPGDHLGLLNAYHAGMHEVILGLEGMLGRVGGDAFTAYFGAPLTSADHARRACLAALRMKAVEKELNIAVAPPFVGRIGIETGACIVGALGSQGMPGYAVVGPANDLAARLEALNSRFGTTILISEPVRDAAGEDFLVRSLDRVRFAGTDAKFRAFELVAEKGAADGTTLQAIESFNEALALFERKEWKEAEALFSRVLVLLPADAPAALYIERCRERLSHPARPAISDPD